MRRTSNSLVAVMVAVVCWMWSGIALASGFADFDPDRESILHGRALPKQTPVAGEADMVGPWTEHDGQLDLGTEEAAGNRFWLVKAGVGDVAEDINETGTGIALPPLDTETVDLGGLDEALESLFAMAADPGMAARCRAVAEERFSLATGVAAYSGIYARLAGNPT